MVCYVPVPTGYFSQAGTPADSGFVFRGAKSSVPEKVSQNRNEIAGIAGIPGGINNLGMGKHMEQMRNGTVSQ